VRAGGRTIETIHCVCVPTTKATSHSLLSGARISRNDSGQVAVRGVVQIKKNGQFKGELHAPSLVIEDCGVFDRVVWIGVAAQHQT